MRLRSACAALAAAAALLAVPTAARAADGPSALFVPADGTAVSTPFATSATNAYDVTVSGTYAYDRFGGLADCGHRDMNSGLAGQDWQADGVTLLVDGAATWCGYYDGSHTYRIRVEGTGAPLRFALSDATGHGDNAGGLTVEVLGDSDLQAHCGPTVGTLTSRGMTTVATIAAWHTNAPVDVVSTGATCAIVMDGYGWGPGYTVQAGGPAAAGVHPVTAQWFSRLSYCVSAWDTRIDGTSRYTGWLCSTQLLEEKT